MADGLKVAISSDFFTAFSQLPQAQQSKMAKFITNFQKNPRSSGINYEKINTARDPNMRSVRIDQTYRGIVLKPESGNVYILLWVDKHDDAYQWAATHQCSINPQTGSIQVFQAIDEETAVPGATAAPQVLGAFDKLKDRELMRLGVPEALVPSVRRITNESELDALEHRLPVEAYEGLFLYFAGSGYDEIINEREQVAADAVDTNDFATALERLDSLSQFAVVEDEVELAAMLNAPLEKWRVFLHPSQRRLVRGNKNGPVRVLGGAGTGKTVVAIHRAKWLAENVVADNKKLLLTTFTKNLATDIQANLKSICSPQQMKKIEVVNLDRWVNQFLRKKKYEYSIVYGSEFDRYWQLALDQKPIDLDLSDAFYKEEWQRVVQAQNVESLDQYKRVSRVGRGTAVNRSVRTRIWPVFEEFRNLLARDKKKEVDDAYRDATALLEHGNTALPYASIVVDEAQDMSTQAFRLIRQLVPEGENDLFIVGDGHQRIYGRNKVVLSHCGINIRGRSRKLRINYRTTEEIRRWAVNLLEGFPVDDLDDGRDTNEKYKALTHGEPPKVVQLASAEAQGRFVAQYLKQQQEDGVQPGHVCVVARTNAEVDNIEQALHQDGVATFRIQPDESDKPDKARAEAVRLATMHRVKGLEFDQVVLASINDGLVPLSQAVSGKGDVVEQRQADFEERCLFYVAVTRAKKAALILSYGQPSPYVAEVAQAFGSDL